MVKISSVNLEKVVGIKSAVPKNGQIEIAFAGKSNVGKSSLINALIGRKSYARTSEKPGKTQTINYYHVNAGISGREDFARDCYLVDLPGYGYAAVSESEKEKWGKMIERYLKTSEMLQVVFLLVDIRHAPSANDRMMADWIADSGKRTVVVATKKDKIGRTQLAKQIRQIRTGLGLSEEIPVIPFSALSREGYDEIWKTIGEL